MKNTKLTVSIIFLVFILLSILGFNYYVLIENQANHTGLELDKVKIIYLIISALAILLSFIFKSEKKVRNLLIISAILGLIFVLNIWIFEEKCIMLFYGDWIQRNMCIP